MTNQEAIKILGQYDVSNIHFYTTDGEEIPFREWSDAIEMAISALQALDEIYAFIMKSEASETTDGVLEIFDALEARDLQSNLQSTCNKLAIDTISRSAALDVIRNIRAIAGSYDSEMLLIDKAEAQTELMMLPSAQPDVPDINVGDLISREAMGDALNRMRVGNNETWYSFYQKALDELCKLPSAQPEQTRTFVELVFVELVVEYPDPELCTYKEFKGKPYYSIKYIENGETYVGYGTYKPKVLSRYLREYFIPSAQPEPCEDAVSRKAVLDLIADYDLSMGQVVNCIHALPPVTPKGKTGKWIDYSEDGYVECPFCHSTTNCDDNIDELHFCFSCGARLEV